MFCTPCQVGQYSQAPGASACFDCNPASYQPRQGASTCVSCPPGSFGGFPGAATCQVWYAYIHFVFVCSFCDRSNPGTYSPYAGLSVCLGCPVGRAAADTNLTSCPPCSGLSYSDAVGLNTCKRCATNQYPLMTSTLSSTSFSYCLPCPPGVLCGYVLCVACVCVCLLLCSRLLVCLCRGAQLLADTGFYIALQNDGQVQAIACASSRCVGGSCPEATNSSRLFFSCCGVNRVPSPMCGVCEPGLCLSPSVLLFVCLLVFVHFPCHV